MWGGGKINTYVNITKNTSHLNKFSEHLETTSKNRQLKWK
jgi:hypothetical protein